MNTETTGAAVPQGETYRVDYVNLEIYADPFLKKTNHFVYRKTRCGKRYRERITASTHFTKNEAIQSAIARAENLKKEGLRKIQFAEQIIAKFGTQEDRK